MSTARARRPLRLLACLLLEACAGRDALPRLEIAIDRPLPGDAWFISGAIDAAGVPWLLPAAGGPLHDPLQRRDGFADSPLGRRHRGSRPTAVAFSAGNQPIVASALKNEVYWRRDTAWAKYDLQGATPVLVMGEPSRVIARAPSSDAYVVFGLDSTASALRAVGTLAWPGPRPEVGRPSVMLAAGAVGAVVLADPFRLEVSVQSPDGVLWTHQLSEAADERIRRSDATADVERAIRYASSLGFPEDGLRASRSALIDSMLTRPVPRLRSGGLALSPDTTVWVLLRSTRPRRMTLISLRQGAVVSTVRVDPDVQALVGVSRDHVYFLAGPNDGAPTRLIGYRRADRAVALRKSNAGA